MAKAYSPDELADRSFLLTVVGVAAFVAAVFFFIL
jgi:hypothetical protein